MNRTTSRAGLQLVLCSASSIGLGYAVFGAQVLDRNLMYFQFVACGVIAGAFIAAWPVLRSRWLVLLAALSYAAAAMLAHSQTLPRLLRDAVWVSAVIAAVGLCIRWDRPLASWKVGKVVAWAATFAAAFTCAVLLLLAIARHALTVNPQVLGASARNGALIGAAVGLGRECANIIAGRLTNGDDGAPMVGRQS